MFLIALSADPTALLTVLPMLPAHAVQAAGCGNCQVVRAYNQDLVLTVLTAVLIPEAMQPASERGSIEVAQ
jgi:hypothetical protein